MITKLQIFTIGLLALIFTGGFFYSPGLIKNMSAVKEDANVHSSLSENKIRILIVPGHEPNFGGAEYGSLKERDMAVELGEDLKNLLENNGKYEVVTTRNKIDWSHTFSDYFKNNYQEIINWEKATKKEYLKELSSGEIIKSTSTVHHNNVSKDVANRLYGVVKWANDNYIDFTIHIHFNNYPYKKGTKPKYSGFSIYVPATQYDNSATSHELAKKILDRLVTTEPISNLKGESKGIVNEPKLIAIGPNNSSKVTTMLIEYGYIYEKKFTDSAIRSQSIHDLAEQTYLGIVEYFK